MRDCSKIEDLRVLLNGGGGSGSARSGSANGELGSIFGVASRTMVDEDGGAEHCRESM